MGGWQLLAMSYTVKYPIRISEQDVGRPAPHMRHPLYMHHSYDRVSNIRACDLTDQRPRPSAAGVLSDYSQSHSDGTVRNLGRAENVPDTFSQADTRHNPTEGINRLKANHPSVKSLTIWNEDLGLSHCTAIADGLRNSTNITHLDLRYCKIGDESCRRIAEGLKANMTLTSLQIKPNNWSKDVGAKWIEKALHYGGWVATNDTIGHCDASDGRTPVYVRREQSLALR